MKFLLLLSSVAFFFLGIHCSSIVFRAGQSVSQPPHHQPSGPAPTGFHLTFLHRHATITDIVLVHAARAWLGWLLCFVQTLLLMQIKPAESGWAHTEEPVWHTDFLPLMCHFPRKGHTTLLWGHCWFPSVSLHDSSPPPIRPSSFNPA